MVDIAIGRNVWVLTNLDRMRGPTCALHLSQSGTMSTSSRYHGGNYFAQMFVFGGRISLVCSAIFSRQHF